MNIVFAGHWPPVVELLHPTVSLPRRFSKFGDMVFVGHLDLMKTFDRACRRAALPVSGAEQRWCVRGRRGGTRACRRAAAWPAAPCWHRWEVGEPGRAAPAAHPTPCPAALPSAADESPFAVRQRIYAALPLPLGATSGGEWLELALTERFEPEAVRSRLQARAGGGGTAGGGRVGRPRGQGRRPAAQPSAALALLCPLTPCLCLPPPNFVSRPPLSPPAPPAPCPAGPAAGGHRAAVS